MSNGNKMKPTCNVCGEHYSPKRKAAGYKTCLWCGEEQALQARKLWTIGQAYSKGGYMLITNKQDLKTINPKNNGLDMTEYVSALAECGEASW